MCNPDVILIVFLFSLKQGSPCAVRRLFIDCRDCQLLEAFSPVFLFSFLEATSPYTLSRRGFLISLNMILSHLSAFASKR